MSEDNGEDNSRFSWKGLEEIAEDLKQEHDGWDGVSRVGCLASTVNRQGAFTQVILYNPLIKEGGDIFFDKWSASGYISRLSLGRIISIDKVEKCNPSRLRSLFFLGSSDFVSSVLHIIYHLSSG